MDGLCLFSLKLNHIYRRQRTICWTSAYHNLLKLVFKYDKTDETEIHKNVSDVPSTITRAEDENTIQRVIDWYRNQDEAERLQ